MASPFRTFRKNQKAWMVAVTILAMISFLFMSQASRFNGQSSATIQDPEIFTWKYGAVRKSDIENRLFWRRIANQFLATAAQKGQLSPQAIAGTQFPVSERDAVSAMLLDKKAEQLGIVVSDAMVNNYIRSVTQDKVSGEELANIIRSMASDRARVSQAQLFDTLRSELAAQYVVATFSPLWNRGNQYMLWFAGDSPGDRWSYFSRLNRKVTAEIMPVSVETFVAQVREPSADEVRKFYDQYKNDEPFPASPTPGFKRPFRAQFQYIKADHEALMKDALAKVTDDEIAQFYEKHKDDLYKKSKMPDLPGMPDQGAGAKPDQSTPEVSKGAEPEKTDSKVDEPKTPDAKTDDAKSNDTKAGESKSPAKSDAAKAESKASNPKSSDPKSAPKAAPTKSGDPKKPADGKQSSSTRSNSLDGELLALADDAILPATEKSTSLTPDSAKAESKSAPSPDPKSEVTADSKTQDTKTPDAKTQGTKTPDTSPTVEYKPLDEVKEKVRQQVAQRDIDDKLRADFAAIQQLMGNYERSLGKYRAAVKLGNTSVKKPEPLTPEFLATPYGLEPHETKLLSAQEAFDSTDIGHSRRTMIGGDYSAPSFIQTAYQLNAQSSPTLPTYQIQQSDDNDDNRYLWWKISDEAANTPSLEDIKSEVIHAWKMIEARAMALKQANADVEQVKKAKQTLKEVFGATAGDEVSTVGPFSWLTQSTAQLFETPRLTLSKVSGVKDIGNDIQPNRSEFMKAVFALRPGETGVAPNQSQTVFYVVQIESEEPPLEELHKQFVDAMSNPMAIQPYAAVGNKESQGIGAAWFTELQNDLDYKLAPGQTLSQSQTLE